MVKVAEKVQAEEQAEAWAEEQEQQAKAGWVAEDWGLVGNVCVLSAEQEHPMNGGYPAMSRSAQSAIHP